MIPPKIITIDAKKLFEYYPKQHGAEDAPYCLDSMNRFFYRQVINQIDVFDECPLLHQIIKTNTFKKSNSDIENSDGWLLDKLLIVDMSGIFNDRKRLDREISEDSDEKSLTFMDKARDLIERGLDLRLQDRTVHMVPFDKSGNMSRHSRISFVDEEYYDELNERLNLGIDFSKIEVVLSKFYAYRGLYLSSSRRAEHEKIKITPETLIVIKDKKMSISGKWEILGPAKENNVTVISAKEDGSSKEANTQKWIFTDPETKDAKGVETPFDGVGIISPKYASYVNDAIDTQGATSFQVRMPFIKGMLHQVDFIRFLSDYDPEGMNLEEYRYTDAFGRKRDLKKAHILITESMFKAFDWITKYTKGDPMKFYCDALNKYEHALYISGTDLPYGHSEYTHLSYQMINTLALNDEQFNTLCDRHNGFIENPTEYITGWDASEAYDNDVIKEDIPTWKRALLFDQEFENDVYISGQLKNTKKGLVTKIADGKLTVPGQTRFLCRDLMPLLVFLIGDQSKSGAFYARCLFMRFYMPLDERIKPKLSEYENLTYSGYAAFFRSPHLSRNEQCVLQPYVLPKEGEDFYPTKKENKEKYIGHVGEYEKYFGHLTGVVMVPRGSIVPLCLGGADFDGDLVSVVYDRDVVKAVRDACYDNWTIRKKEFPVIEIPKTEAVETNVPRFIPFDHIEKTFSNHIGYLSNTAISIGQTEYGNELTDSFDKNGPACWKCTILTGLDIDAAKNGKHPDLEEIRQYDIPKAPYLAFKDSFRQFRNNPSYSFDDMEIRTVNIQKKDCLEISSSKIAKKVRYDLSQTSYGTKINKLPALFAEGYELYKNTEKKTKQNKISKKNLFIFSTRDDTHAGEDVMLLKENCEELFSLHFKYKKLAEAVGNSVNKRKYGIENLENQIFKAYDSENETEINSTVLPGLRYKLDQSIPEGISVGEIKSRLNEYKWEFQPKDNRGMILEKIIGNDFRFDSLTEEEQDFITSFDQQGYRTLWYLLTDIGDYRTEPLEDIYDRVMNSFAQKNTEDEGESNRLTGLKKRLDREIRAYYDGGHVSPVNILYAKCLSELREIFERSELELETKIRLLNEITENDRENRRFFWDVFTWDELMPYTVSRKAGESVVK